MSKGWACHAYYQVNPFVGACKHDSMLTVPAPPFQIPWPLWHIDFGVAQGLWIGSFLSTGYDKEVKGDGLHFLGRMSDAGLGIPHISIPPSWFNLLTSLFAMSNAVFGSGSVQMGCHNLLWGNDDCDVAATPFGPVPLSVNLGCFDPFCLPTDLVVVWGTVYVGMSWNDIAAAMIDIAISIATDLLSRGLGAGLSKLGTKIGRGSANKAVKFLTGTLSCEAYETYAKRAVATQGLGNALQMSDDDMARFATKEAGGQSMKESIEKLDGGVEKFVREWGDQFTGNLDEAWEGGFKEALEHLDALKSAGLADDVARKAAAQTLLEEAFDELKVAMKAVGKVDLIAAMELKMLKGTLTSALSATLLSGNALGGGTSGGALSFEGAGWWSFLGTRRGAREKYGEDDFISLYDDADEESWGVGGGSDEDDDYWFGGTLYDLTSTAEEASEDDDDYWWDATAGGGSAS